MLQTNEIISRALGDPNLSMSSFRLLTYIAERAKNENTKTIEANNVTLAKKICATERTIYTAKKELAEWGYIKSDGRTVTLLNVEDDFTPQKRVQLQMTKQYESPTVENRECSDTVADSIITAALNLEPVEQKRKTIEEFIDYLKNYDITNIRHEDFVRDEARICDWWMNKATKEQRRQTMDVIFYWCKRYIDEVGMSLTGDELRAYNDANRDFVNTRHNIIKYSKYNEY